MKRIGLHKLHMVREFANNHNNHKISLKDNNNPTVEIKTSGEPCSEKSAEYKAELLVGELQLLRSYVEVVLKKTFINSTVDVTIKELNKFIDFIETNLYQDIN